MELELSRVGVVQSQSCPELSGLVRTHFESLRVIRSRPESSEVVWSRLEMAQNVWNFVSDSKSFISAVSGRLKPLFLG